MNEKDYKKAKKMLWLLKKIRLNRKDLEEQRKENIKKLEEIIKRYDNGER